MAAGAVGIVIGNNAAGLPPSPAGTAPAGFYGVTVTQADGTRFKSAGTASVTVQAEDISTRFDSTRWLMGEKSDGVRGCDPRHVDAHLLRRPGQGDRRRVQL